MEEGLKPGSIATAYSPHQHRPLGPYALLTGAFATAVAAFVAGQRRSGRELPERLPAGDLALIAAATQKLSRQIAKDKVTSFLRAPFMRYTGEAGPAEVSEEPRGEGMRLAVGELLGCPYCLAQWIATCFVGGYLVRPRTTRAVASVFATLSAADFLQLAYAAAQEKA